MVGAAKSASMAFSVVGFSVAINCLRFWSPCVVSTVDGPSTCLFGSLFVSCSISLLTSLAERLVVVVLLKVVLPRYGLVTIGVAGAADDKGICVGEASGIAAVGTAIGIDTEANVLETSVSFNEFMVGSFGVVGVVPSEIVIGTGIVELAVLVVTEKFTVVATAETSLGRVIASIGTTDVDVARVFVTLPMSFLWLASISFLMMEAAWLDANVTTMNSSTVGINPSCERMGLQRPFVVNIGTCRIISAVACLIHSTSL